jgi:hypothetical protein
MDPRVTTTGTIPLSEPHAPIASISLLGQPPAGVPCAIEVEIGAPYKLGDSPEQWACPLKAHPLLPKPKDIYGGNSLQALSMALGLVGVLLQDFIDKGGKLLLDDGSEFEPRSYRLGAFR